MTFAAGIGTVAGAVATVGMLAGKLPPLDVLRIAGKTSVVSFLVGVLFSGVLAIVARRRSFDTLSLRFVASVGAGGGFAYWCFLAATGGRVAWDWRDAVGNLGLLLVVGSIAASGTFLLARRAGRAIAPGDSTAQLGEGAADLHEWASDAEPASERVR